MNNLLKFAPHVTRILLGLLFLVFGLNYFFKVLPTPPMEGAALEFMKGLAGTGYFFPFVKVVEIAVGIALLSNRFVPLALVVLAPVTVNIALLNFILAPAGIPVTIVVLALHLFTMWSYRDYYRVVVSAKAPLEEGSPELARARATA
jgi:uncharacterized membrane protein YphA (DoxX/SURF4 family)